VHDEYFRVDPIGGSRRLSDSERKAVTKLWTYPMVDLAKLTPAVLLDEIRMKAH
jgi:hypothetical protein